MAPSDKPQFATALAGVMAAYGKPLPERALVDAWFNELAPFSPATIAAAFAGYRVERPDHAPVPNSIAARCLLLDGRPDENEAWALALATRDEADTVVWTAEAAAAFASCRPVLALGDEVGARMAFKDAYTRLVAQARAAHVPVVWSVSLGHDPTTRAAAITRAVAAGLLPSPQTAALLAGPEHDPTPDEKARAQLASIRKMLAEGAAARELRLEQAKAAERQADEDFKARTQAQVDSYVPGRTA